MGVDVTNDVFVGPTPEPEGIVAADGVADLPNKKSPAIIGGGYAGAPGALVVVVVASCCCVFWVCCVSVTLEAAPEFPSMLPVPVPSAPPAAAPIAACNNPPIFNACKILCAASQASFAAASECCDVASVADVFVCAF